MKCIIPNVNLKVFGKAIQSLSKIGEELYFEPLDHGLALRTVNSCRSAFAGFLFTPSFFAHYDDGAATATEADSDEEVLRCKIGMKSCLSVFKSISILEKTVDKCKITLDLKESRLIFQMYCRHGIVKTYNLTFIECETLQAVFDKSHCPNILAAQTRLLAECVLNFQSNQEEISLIFDTDKCKIKNYTDDEPDPLKIIKTEMTLTPEEFDTYQIVEEGEVTFCLKELRAILAFADAANLPVAMHFETAGKPIIVSIESDITFDANFVLATLAEPSSQVNASQRSTQGHITQFDRTGPRSIRRQNGGHSASRRTNGAPGRGGGPSGDHRRGARNTNPYDDENFGDAGPSAVSDRVQRSRRDPQESGPITSATEDSAVERPRRSAASRVGAAFNEFISETELDHPLPEMETTTKGSSQLNDSRLDDPSPVIPLVAELTMTLVDSELPEGLATTTTEEEEAEDEVPGTPPAKKFKSRFFGLSQSTVGSQGPSINFGAVLAEDSEEDT